MALSWEALPFANEPSRLCSIWLGYITVTLQLSISAAEFSIRATPFLMLAVHYPV